MDLGVVETLNFSFVTKLAIFLESNKVGNMNIFGFVHQTTKHKNFLLYDNTIKSSLFILSNTSLVRPKTAMLLGVNTHTP